MQKKIKKNINISLQTKKFLAPINGIIDKWEGEGENVSVKICDLIIFFDKFDNSFTLSNVKNIVELSEKMISRHISLDSIEGRRLLEEILSECITVDNNKLSTALNNLDKSNSIEKNLQQSENRNLLNNKSNIPDENKIEMKKDYKKDDKEVVFEYDDNNDNDDDEKNKIPYNFLFNS